MVPGRDVENKVKRSIEHFNVARYSRKNLSRRKLRTGLTISSVALCIAFFVLLSALSQGMHEYILNELEQFHEGRIELFVFDGRTPLNDTEVKELEAVAQDYCSRRGTGCWVERSDIKVFAYERTEGFMGDMYHIVGVDQKTGFNWWYGNYNFKEKLRAGAHLDTIASTDNGIVLGYRTWERFFNDKKVGDYIDIIPKNASQYEWGVFPAESYPLEDKDNITRVPISGIYGVKIIGILAENIETDYFLYIPLEFMLQTFKQNDEDMGYYYQSLAVFIEDARKIDFDDLEEQLANSSDKLDGWDNRWELGFETFEGIKNTIDSWLLIMSVIFVFIILAGVSNTMSMSVLERRREIGILKAIGVKRKGIILLILFEALFICGIALIIGLIFGSLVSLYFSMNFDPYNISIFIAPAKITPMVIILASVLSLGFGVLSSLYPARKALKLDPVEVFRFE
ncbi:ABC transporter permease [[Eubacterium] cellulosolvens]